VVAKFCIATQAVRDNGHSSAPYRNFRYRIVETPRYAKLLECFLGTETVIGQVGGWRIRILREIARGLEGKDERERGYRLFLALNLLKSIDDTRKVGIFWRAMNEITLEETIFWVWQYHSYGKAALNAFNCIHMNSCKKGIVEI
jgi:hypothetical protein